MRPDAAAEFELGEPFDLRLTLAPLRRSGLNPSVRFLADGVWRATRTPAGAATERLVSRRGVVRVEAWGPGAQHLVEQAPILCGARDNPSDFRPSDPFMRSLVRRFPGLRFARSASVLEALVPTILEQKVQGMEAWHAHAALIRALGEPAPGPVPLRLPPAPERLAEARYFVYHRLGIERRRAEAIRFAAAHAGRLEEIVALSPEEATRRLRAFPLVGPWSVAEVSAVALGDPDAVSVGDFHLPHLVAYAFRGQRRGSDELMLELLEPFRGHRGRALRYLELGGSAPARRAPRRALRDVASM